jgi:hypothetical protein
MAIKHQKNLFADLIVGPPWLKHWARAFALASLVHLTLPDFEQSGWATPRIIEGLGALILLWRPSALGFGLCLLGTAWPLLFLRDVLTQSMLLTWMAALGVFGALCSQRAILSGVTWITAGTYWLAALHKLNAGFFNLEISCAQHAWHQVLDRWTWLPETQFGQELAISIVAIEITIGVLIVKRSLWAWVIGIVFHFPLTVTLAPAFGAVMFCGFAAGLTPRQVAILRRSLALNKVRWVGGGLVFVLVDIQAHFETLNVAILLKCFVFGGLFAGFLLGAIRLSDGGWNRPNRWVALYFGLWILHGLTPYIGVQYQHTSAMLSNLRIDTECHNSFVFPESLIFRDPYVRIDQAHIGQGQRPQREATLKSGLWSFPALATMHRNWCIEELRPIRLEGSYGERSFIIEDLCKQDWYRSLVDSDSLRGFQRFQKNLKRRCEAECVH